MKRSRNSRPGTNYNYDKNSVLNNDTLSLLQSHSLGCFHKRVSRVSVGFNKE
jgi:hypothetical protein